MAAVADGMGGHLGGEQASNLAIQSLEDELLSQNQTTSDGQIDSWIASAIEDANSLVYKHSLDNPELGGMGTTLSLIYFSNSRMYWGHIETAAFISIETTHFGFLPKTML